ncbi:MAG: DnaJ domain-containing protein, partial [Pseudomonadota bacterium]
IVTLDLATGDVDGGVKSGAYRGRTLSQMTPAELADLWQSCQFDDPEGAQILEAYLDRRHPTWREDAQRAAGGGAGADDASGMTVTEARAILGVAANATKDEITRAYKRAMMEVHPDRGGTDEDAARINQAKEVLLGG